MKVYGALGGALLLTYYKLGFKVAVQATITIISVVLGYVYYYCNPQISALLNGSLVSTPSSASRTCAYDQEVDWQELASEDGLVDTGDYYAEYHGHRLSDLARVHSTLSDLGCRRFIFLAGDSSLDNKHWFFPGFRTKNSVMKRAGRLPKYIGKAVNGYEHVLSPPRMVKDVSYWLNEGAETRLGASELCTIMTSVEESTISDRDNGLLAQDIFIRDHITHNDYLVLSVGGNDVALRPTLQTTVNMLMLTRCPDWLIKSGYAPGFAYFVRLFKGQVQDLLQRMTAKQKPKHILACMIYYLDEKRGGSWADHTLAALGYDANPAKLQLIISTLYDVISKQEFQIEGTKVTPFPLFKVLDGKTTSDYEQRVEPSVSGGHKMATAILSALLDQE